MFGGSPSEQAAINHGTYFFHAAQEGLLANDTNIHAGIRTTLSGPSDYENDGYCGFQIVEAREIDKIGTDGIIKRIKERVGTDKPVYLSIDIDTLDPACKLPLHVFSLYLPDTDVHAQSLLQLAPLRLAAGPRASCAPSSAAWRASTSSPPTLSKSLQHTTPTPSLPPWLPPTPCTRS